MKIQWPKNKIQDPLSKKKRKDKVMWYEREWKKKKKKVTMNTLRLRFQHTWYR
jgi:hypothetical protein